MVQALHIPSQKQRAKIPGTQHAEGKREGYRVAETFPDVATHSRLGRMADAAGAVGLSSRRVMRARPGSAS